MNAPQVAMLKLEWARVGSGGGCISLNRRTDTARTKWEDRLPTRPVEIDGDGRAKGP
jgi:hypothetical protein